MLFIAENELERALVAAVKVPAAGPDFYRLLLASNLLVLGTVEGQEDAAEKVSLTPNSRLNLVSGLKDGTRYLPVFSSLTRIQEYVARESKYLSVNGRALLDLTRGAPIILNPASEYGKELTPDQVRQLLDGGQVRTVFREAAHPTALLDMLMGLFATRSDVEAAWVAQVAPTDRPDESHPLIGIETQGAPKSDWPSLMQEIQAAAKKSLPGVMFDVQRVDRYSPTGMASALLQTEPFYRRRILN